jgi:hypothetical protein
MESSGLDVIRHLHYELSFPLLHAVLWWNEIIERINDGSFYRFPLAENITSLLFLHHDSDETARGSLIVVCSS